ncbi:MAG: glycoside hydrolase family 2 [Clostridiales bacterium]|nr:glycoside hydrolase family 2 [Clostridiales bacterium]
MNRLYEYPRPQFRRQSFFSLDGIWQLNGKSIRVPFPPESKLSDFSDTIEEALRYTRTFVLPEGFHTENERVRLYFGAVDQIAEVHVNGHFVTRHEGGYLPFFGDITDFLIPGENELLVIAEDTLSQNYPYGKQCKKRGGMWYTPVSGIWQSVWLEAVPECPIERIRISCDLSGIDICVESELPECTAEIPGIVKTVLPTNTSVRIDVPNPHLWSPEDPYLYPIYLRTQSDTVESYFALRTIRADKQTGRILLNEKPVFLNGVLDQGYFADGLYLPGDMSEYERDILRMREMGINFLRKHIKIEPEAFYYACDRLGMLVMQDMVNSGIYNFLRDTALPTIGFTRKSDKCKDGKSNPRKAFFTRHCIDTQNHLFNHPCIIAYTIFNEGWGQFNADEHYALLKANDPTRFYDSTSGWFWQKKSDVDSVHIYFRNKTLKPGKRPLFLSECGGYARPIPGHMFNPNGKYGYGTADSENALTSKIETMWRDMIFPAIPKGLCGVVYTQLSDIEDEINGLYTYDRAVCKVDVHRMKALADKAQHLAQIPKEQ